MRLSAAIHQKKMCAPPYGTRDCTKIDRYGTKCDALDRRRTHCTLSCKCGNNTHTVIPLDRPFESRVIAKNGNGTQKRHGGPCGPCPSKTTPALPGRQHTISGTNETSNVALFPPSSPPTTLGLSSPLFVATQKQRRNRPSCNAPSTRAITHHPSSVLPHSKSQDHSCVLKLAAGIRLPADRRSRGATLPPP